MKQKNEEQVQEPKPRVKQAWKEKEKSKNDKESLIIQKTFKAQNKSTIWILDSGCLSHMIKDR